MAAVDAFELTALLARVAEATSASESQADRADDNVTPPMRRGATLSPFTVTGSETVAATKHLTAPASRLGDSHRAADSAGPFASLYEPPTPAHTVSHIFTTNAPDTHLLFGSMLDHGEADVFLHAKQSNTLHVGDVPHVTPPATAGVACEDPLLQLFANASLRATPVGAGASSQHRHHSNTTPGVGNLDGFVHWVQNQTPTGGRSGSVAASTAAATALGGSFHGQQGVSPHAGFDGRSATSRSNSVSAPVADTTTLYAHPQQQHASPWKVSSGGGHAAASGTPNILLGINTPPRTMSSTTPQSSSSRGGAANAGSFFVSSGEAHPQTQHVFHPPQGGYVDVAHGLSLPSQMPTHHHHWTMTPPHRHFNAAGAPAAGGTAQTSLGGSGRPTPLKSTGAGGHHQLDPTAAAFEPFTPPPTITSGPTVRRGAPPPPQLATAGHTAPMFSSPAHLQSASGGASPHVHPHNQYSLEVPFAPLFTGGLAGGSHPHAALVSGGSPDQFHHIAARRALPHQSTPLNHSGRMHGALPPSPSIGGIMTTAVVGVSCSASPLQIGELYKGHVVEAAKDQSGCRALQKFFEAAASMAAGSHLDAAPLPDVQSVLNEISPMHTVELMSDAYGNFLIQKILEVSSDDVRLRITSDVAPSLALIATTPHGTFAVQKLVESLRSEQETTIVCNGLARDVPLLLNDVNGGHVVQKVLQCIAPQHREFLFRGIAEHMTQVCNHRQGCCVVQKCLEQATPEQFFMVHRAAVASIASSIPQASSSPQRAPLGGVHQQQSHPSELLLTLMCDPYGNYVISKLLERGSSTLSPQHRVVQLGQYVDSIGRAARANPAAGGFDVLLHLCTDKFSSNVMEKLLKANAGLPSFDALVGLILGGQQKGHMAVHGKQHGAPHVLQQQPRALSILFGGSGNYVIQSALTLSPVPLPRQLFRSASTPPPCASGQPAPPSPVADDDRRTTTPQPADAKEPSDVSTCNLALLVESLLPSMSVISQQNFGKKVEAALADALGRLLQAGYALPQGMYIPPVLHGLMVSHHEHHPHAHHVTLFAAHDAHHQHADHSSNGTPYRHGLQHPSSAGGAASPIRGADGAPSLSTPRHQLPHVPQAPAAGGAPPSEPMRTTRQDPFAAFGVFEAGVDVTPPRPGPPPSNAACHNPPPGVALFGVRGAHPQQLAHSDAPAAVVAVRPTVRRPAGAQRRDASGSTYDSTAAAGESSPHRRTPPPRPNANERGSGKGRGEVPSDNAATNSTRRGRHNRK